MKNLLYSLLLITLLGCTGTEQHTKNELRAPALPPNRYEPLYKCMVASRQFV